MNLFILSVHAIFHKTNQWIRIYLLQLLEQFQLWICLGFTKNISSVWIEYPQDW